MSEATAAMALTSLDGFERAVAHNRSNFDAYAAGLDRVPGVRLLPHDPSESRNYQYVIVEIDEYRGGDRPGPRPQDSAERERHGEAVLLPRLP